MNRTVNRVSSTFRLCFPQWLSARAVLLHPAEDSGRSYVNSTNFVGDCAQNNFLNTAGKPKTFHKWQSLLGAMAARPCSVNASHFIPLFLAFMYLSHQMTYPGWLPGHFHHDFAMVSILFHCIPLCHLFNPVLQTLNLLGSVKYQWNSAQPHLYRLHGAESTFKDGLFSFTFSLVYFTEAPNCSFHPESLFHNVIDHKRLTGLQCSLASSDFSQ